MYSIKRVKRFSWNYSLPADEFLNEIDRKSDRFDEVDDVRCWKLDNILI